jgi:hypothetical protein
MKNALFFATGVVLLALTASCNNESAKIQVQSKIHNVRINNISFGSNSIGGSLGPGESTDKTTIEDKEKFWPKTYQIEFYMNSNGNQVYLKTRQKYELNPGDDLLIVISDTSKVYNPMFE